MLELDAYMLHNYVTSQLALDSLVCCHSAPCLNWYYIWLGARFWAVDFTRLVDLLHHPDSKLAVTAVTFLFSSD